MKMDRNGMYPQHPCRRCGAMLNADGYHASELYAGVGCYTGLCDACKNAPMTVVWTYRDGAVRLEYPPGGPSGRRNRQHYTAYPDCTQCKGEGYRWGSNVTGWPMRHYCEPCLRRWSGDPGRAWYERMRIRTLPDLVQARWTRALVAYRKAHRLPMGARIPDDAAAAMHAPMLAQYQRIQARLDRIARARGIIDDDGHLT